MKTAWQRIDRVRRSLLILCLITLVSGTVWASDMPAPLCAGTPTPAFSLELGATTVDAWLDQHGLEDRSPPPCLDWQEQTAMVLIAVAGRFQHDGTIDELLARLGAASRYMSIS